MSLFSQQDPTKMLNSLGEAFKKFVLAKVEEPLPILPARTRVLGANLPKFRASLSSEALGQINGRPFKESFA